MSLQSEIHKFTSKSSEWWNTQGSFKLLHEINPIRLNFIVENSIDIDFSNAKLLDVGCGGGILCESLISIGFQDKNITGLDAGRENIEVAKEHAFQNNYQINYVNSVLEDFNSPELFDIVTAFEVIEHCDYYDIFLKKLSSLVKPGGLIFISTINRTIKSYLQAIIGAEYILRWLPRNTHQWKKFLKPSEIDRVLLQNECEIQKMEGIKFDILTQTWYSTKNSKGCCGKIDVNYMLMAKKLNKNQ